jgi:D-3-phosphoglycerate dehydrogenase
MKVLISDPLAKEGVQILKDAGFEVVEKPGMSPEELIQTIPEFDAIVVRGATKVRKEVIDAATNLKVIGRAGVGLDNVDRDAASARNIKVLNTPAATSASVAELALGMIFALTRNVVRGTIGLRGGQWEKKALKSTEVGGKTLGIIGIGRIGSELAKRAKALGMKVVAFDAIVKDSDVAEMVDMDTLLTESDYISVHVPGGESTKDLIGKAEFDKMKDGVYFVNCSRGGVVNEDALFEAMKSGKVKAAAADVFATEPPGEHKLFELDNFIATPHIGAQTAEGQLRAGTQIAEYVRDALKG